MILNMLGISIFIGALFFVFVCVIAVAIYHKWVTFKELKPGDICGVFVDHASDMKAESITKVDTDELGYTTRIYTPNNSYTFWDCINNNVKTLYED